jgi:1-deoxy-D-xylulose-5-phosphate reductoisomerase
VLAQLSAPDMRTPIAYTLAGPDRAALATARLDLAALGSLSFEKPDSARFPALDLARAALRAGPASGGALNAANEVAVEAFLQGRIRFLDIARLVEVAMSDVAGAEPALIAKTPSSLDDVRAVDQAARRAARRIAGTLAAA